MHHLNTAVDEAATTRFLAFFHNEFSHLFPASLSPEFLAIAAGLTAIGLSYTVISYIIWRKHYNLVLFSHLNPLLFASDIDTTIQKSEDDDGTAVSLKVYANSPCYICPPHNGFLSCLLVHLTFFFVLSSLLFTELSYVAWATRFFSRLQLQIQLQKSAPHSLPIDATIEHELQFASCLLLWGLVLKTFHAKAARLGLRLACRVRSRQNLKTEYKRVLRRIIAAVVTVSLASGLCWYIPASASSSSSPSIFTSAAGSTTPSSSLPPRVPFFKHIMSVASGHGSISTFTGTLPGSSTSHALRYIQAVLCGLVVFSNLVLCFFERAGQFTLDLSREGSKVSKTAHGELTAHALFASATVDASPVRILSTHSTVSPDGSVTLIYTYVFTILGEGGVSPKHFLIYHKILTTPKCEQHCILANVPHPFSSRSGSSSTNTQKLLVQIPALASISFTRANVLTAESAAAQRSNVESVILELMTNGSAAFDQRPLV